ncbi:hypothetical protein [Desulfatitalea alkaliphila]|uniref:Uncharacterized protein n=1 Tax=Desulfatitalea alkaliphila TaxID=2929485 RepID=A0AA41R5R9_9BACT|nr:hypothetical protein [Desulfatitalea alkaliphila]MCJ8502311.1 hypothetical protein [Desulfatitalea alkaliphila]
MDKTIRYLLILFAVVGFGLLGYHWIGHWHTNAVEQAVNDEKALCRQRLEQLQDRIDALTARMDTGPPVDDLSEVFGPHLPTDTTRPEQVDCNRITTQVAAFFNYLDGKGYVTEAGLEMRAETFFDETLERLAATTPTNVGELNNLYGLLRNVTHLYRVLGKDRLLLIKQILDEEGAVLEPAMAVIFSWLTVCAEGRPVDGEPPRLQPLYEYAAYFLNTMGGRGYLLRRDSKMRMLINYYALLTLDMANEHRRNAYGVDIRPHLDYLFYDINNQRGLMYRERYLAQLAALRNKYF